MMSRSLRLRLVTDAFLIALPGLANAQVATIPGVSQSGTVPTGFQAQGFKLDCNNATPTSGQCWPLMEIWDGTTQVQVNASDHGIITHVANTNANGQALAANSSPVVLPAAQVTVDPCALSAKTNLAVSTNATTLTQIISASGSNKIYICSVALIAPGATAFNLNTGTATNCASTTAALIGSTTAANGMSFVANGGITLGNGSGTVAVSAASSALCTLQSNAVQVAGNITYVQAP